MRGSHEERKGVIVQVLSIDELNAWLALEGTTCWTTEASACCTPDAEAMQCLCQMLTSLGVGLELQ